MATYEEVKQQIKDLGYADTFGTKKEIKYLPEILKEDEKVLGLTSGLMDGNTWIIAFTKKRIIFLDKGMFYGLKQVETPLSKINSIEHSTGFLMGDIAIWDGASKMKIGCILKESVVPFVNALNDTIDELKSPTTPTLGNVSVSDELIKLSELKEKGILTEDEFLEQKRKILAA